MGPMSPLLPMLLAGLGGGALALALRELARASPQLARSAESALIALTLAGRLGRDATSSERRGLGLALAACFGLVTLLLFGLKPPALLAFLGPAGAERLLSRRRRRYREAVGAGVPALARALSDALAAGGSLRSALIDAAPTLEGACGAELRRVRVDLELGSSPATALRAFAARIGSKPVAALVSAAVSQQRTGGDLATLLRRQADAEAGRLAAEAAARSATAQARLSGGIVAGMPLAAALLVELVSPGFVPGIAADPVAAVLLLAAAALQLTGYLAIQRLGRPPA
jgi:tight adherence protein B